MGIVYSLNEDCSDISDWNDFDTGSGASTQITFDGEETFKMLTGSTGNNSAIRHKIADSAVPTIFITEIKLYHSALGTEPNLDFFRYSQYNAENRLQVVFATDGMFIYNGSDWIELGTNIVSTGGWNTWRFEVEASTPASATVEVFKDNVSQGTADVDEASNANDDCYIEQLGFATASRLTYIDYIQVYYDVPSGRSYGYIIG